VHSGIYKKGDKFKMLGAATSLMMTFQFVFDFDADMDQAQEELEEILKKINANH
jgi:hypothetical protein